MKKLGASGTVTLFPGVASAASENGGPTQKYDVSVNRLSEDKAGNLVEELMDRESTQTVLQKVRNRGFTMDLEQAVTKTVDAEYKNEQVRGIVVPLETEYSRIENYWNETNITDSLRTTIGYLTADTDKNTDPAAFILGISDQGVTANEILRPQSSQTLSFPEPHTSSGTVVQAMKIITPDDTYTGSVSQSQQSEKEVRSTESVGIQSEHTVRECFLDNQGILNSVGVGALCKACAVPDPSDASTVSLILQCVSCMGAYCSANCLLGYCQKEDGGSIGEKFCKAAGIVMRTPVAMLPPGQAQMLQGQAACIFYGCNSNESTDCITPLVD